MTRSPTLVKPPLQEATRSRADRKEETRRRILDAALRLVEEGRSPDAIGLREVARAAGMAAPSIYNHFADMDALGLALVDDALIRLRAIARAARSEMAQRDTESVLRILLQQFLLYMNKYESVLRLLMQQWFNPNPEYRKTIRRELAIMQEDLAGYMREAASMKGLNNSDYDTESEAVLSLLIVYVIDALDLDRSKREERLDKVEKQIMMLVRGSRVTGAPD